MKKATVAAELGHFIDPDRCKPLSSDRLLAAGLLHILRSGMAAVMQHRMSPAALLSEVGIALSIAADPQLAARDADRVALEYTHRARKLLYDSSLNVPLRPSEDPGNFMEAMKLFLRKDTGLYTESKEAVASCAGKGGKGPGASVQPASKTPIHCVRYAVGTSSVNCNRSDCVYSHECPFCDGKYCNHKAGYLQKHLSSLKTPMLITSKISHGNTQNWSSARGSRHRSRSRSPRRSSRGRHSDNRGQGGEGGRGAGDQRSGGGAPGQRSY